MAGQRRLRLGILASGSGTNLQAILDAAAGAAYEVAVVVSNVPGAFALERARRAGIPAVAAPSKGVTREEHEADLERALEAHRVEFVVLAGYMRVLTPAFVERWNGCIVNVHPGLLPAFPGTHAPRQALEYGARIAGCTFHFVDAEVDHGPIILQVAVPVLPGDDEGSLTARIQAEERRHFWIVLDWLARGNVRLEGRRVVVTGADPNAPPEGRLVSPTLAATPSEAGGRALPRGPAGRR